MLRYAECCVLFIVMLVVVMLNGMLSVIRLNVVMLSVLAPLAKGQFSK